ncbi:MAG: penicillin-binding transpeptidase domain-containing protein [Phycisphaerales bacterium]
MIPGRPTTNPFQRRLVLIAGLMVLVVVVLSIRHAWLSVANGDANYRAALVALRSRTLLPTWRGQIVDAEERIVARDAAGYAVEARFNFVVGSRWVNAMSRLAAEREVGRARWRALPSTEQEARADVFRPEFRAVREAIMRELALAGDTDAATLQTSFDGIARRVQSMKAHVSARQYRTWIATPGNEDDPAAFRPPKLTEELGFHRVVDDLAADRAYLVRARLQELQLEDSIRVVDSRIRARPWNERMVEVDGSTLPDPVRYEGTREIPVRGIADHIVGRMRPVWRADVERRPYQSSGDAVDLGGYRAVGDRTGSYGLERVREDHLRGTRGERREARDTDTIQVLEPQPGDDLHLAIDIELQTLIQAVLHPDVGLTSAQAWHSNPLVDLGGGGRPLRAAVAVIEIETGEVRALVSGPSLAEASDPTRRPAPDPVLDAVRWSPLDLAAEGAVVPGSIVKPLVLMSAAAAGVSEPGREIECTGHYFSHNQTVARCWIYRERYGLTTHGQLAGPDAIAQSCNIYFHRVASEMGAERMSDWFSRFGMGDVPRAGMAWYESPTELIPGHWRGAVPGVAPDGSEIRRSDARAFRTIMLGTGQEAMAWSPLQAANAYATIARGGLHLDPTIVAPASRREPQLERDLEIPPAAVDAALTGLWRSVHNPEGTGHHITHRSVDPDGTEHRRREIIFTADGVDVWGKTGTAQEAVRLGPTNEAGALTGPVHTLTHGWFAGLVGPEGSPEPLFAIAVLVEWGGSGGRVAGPIANQVILALQRTGRLPGGDALEPIEILPLPSTWTVPEAPEAEDVASPTGEQVPGTPGEPSVPGTPGTPGAPTEVSVVSAREGPRP